jgi:membrane-bound lytic murein transglycosylase B
VPAEIIVGIIGVETIYGQQMGNFRVMDALATLAFDFPTPPARRRTHRVLPRELEQFLSLTTAPTSIRSSPAGSYAGAMGLGQFMPSSWVRYAVDFDGDGRIDLFSSPADAIGSVANYFKAHGWTPGMPTHYSVQFDPSATVQTGRIAGPRHPAHLQRRQHAGQGRRAGCGGRPTHRPRWRWWNCKTAGDAPSYVAGTENFYAITRYNWSSYYAMAVIELGREVAAVPGQMKTISSSPAVAVAGAVDADAAGAAAAALAAGAAWPTGGVAPAGATDDDATGLDTAPVAGLAAAVAATGGTTRSTCPTSIRFGFSRLFQRTMSRQACPVSRPMRITVSPRFTV